MSYTVHYNDLFAVEFANFHEPQQNAVLDFAETFMEHGLGDFSKYEGKITYSWKGLAVSDPVYRYARANDLWHYHLGIPTYETRHGKYKTSDVVLHFQWPDRGNTIALVDVYDHYRADGSFYLPPQSYLARA